MNDIIKTIITGFFVMMTIAFVISLSVMLLPLTILYMIGKWHRDNME